MSFRPGLLEVSKNQVTVTGNGRVVVFGTSAEPDFTLAPVVQSGLTLYLDSRDASS